MINYYYSINKKISRLEFQNEIDKAIKSISQSEEISKNEIEMTRNTSSIAISTSKENCSGEYVIYNITKNNKIIGQLSCFIDDRMNFFEIITHTL